MSRIADVRESVLAGIPVADRRREVAGVATAVLEGGGGPPMVLLHGPGEVAAIWLGVLAELATTHRVVAPDLPGHGASSMPDGGLSTDGLLGWLGELIEQMCPQPPTLVGRIVGGAIGARFAMEYPGKLAHLVLVDTMGLVPFDPEPRFALAMQRFLTAPSDRNYDRFMEFCMFDLDGVRDRLGQRWAPFASYSVERAGSPEVQAALGSLIGLFAAPIPPEQLARIDVPTTLIWGRHDLANPLPVAQQASARYGWPLHVIEGAGDDPPLDNPSAFLQALRDAITQEV